MVARALSDKYRRCSGCLEYYVELTEALVDLINACIIAMDHDGHGYKRSKATYRDMGKDAHKVLLKVLETAKAAFKTADGNSRAFHEVIDLCDLSIRARENVKVNTDVLKSDEFKLLQGNINT